MIGGRSDVRVGVLVVLVEVVQAHQEVLELPAQHHQDVPVAQVVHHRQEVLPHPLEELGLLAAQCGERFLGNSKTRCPNNSVIQRFQIASILSLNTRTVIFDFSLQ